MNKIISKSKFYEIFVVTLLSMILSFYVASYVNLRVAEHTWHMCGAHGEIINSACSDYDDHLLIFSFVFLAMFLLIYWVFNFIKKWKSRDVAMIIFVMLVIAGFVSMRFDQITCSRKNGRSTIHSCMGITRGGQKIWDATGVRLI